MKKAIVLLLALAVLGGAVFAQDAPALKFSGALFGGLTYDNATNDLLFNRWYGAGTTDNMFRVRLNGSYTNGNIGAAFRLQTNDATNPTFTRAFGWATFFDGLLKVNVGKLGDYTWATAWNLFGNFDGSEGMQFILAPIDGLSLGFFLPENIAADGVKIDTQMQDLDFGFAYSMSGLGKVVGGYMMTPTAGHRAYFGIDVTAVENLLARVEGNFTNLGGEKTAATYLWERFGYTMGDLYAQLTLDQNFYADSAKELALSVTPYVSYNLADWTFGTGFTYVINEEGVKDANTWSLDPHATLAIKNGELEVGASIMKDEKYRIYTMWTFNF
jgi:hypothetical protein